MKMNKIIYLNELQNYSSDELLSRGVHQDLIVQLLKENICNKSKYGKIYTIAFVGIITYNNYVLCILPKYVSKDITQLDKKQRIIQIIKVLKKYAQNIETQFEDANFLQQDINDTLISDLGLADYLILDYLNYGIYQKERRELVLNTEGEIDWQNTIDKLSPYTSKKRPLYLEYYNTINVSEDINNISRIHKWALANSITKYAELLDYSMEADLDADIDINIIGSNEFLLSLLEREIQSTYIDRDINLLKALHTVISRRYTSDCKNFTLYGTAYFEHVWEKVCSTIFNNEYEFYKQYIHNPKWVSIDGHYVEKETFKPDIIRTFKSDSDKYFLILDAKYYNIRFKDNELFNNPGVGDISKQLLYEKALEKASSGYNKENIFLFPSELNEDYKVFGFVSMDFICDRPVTLIYISAQNAYNLYINSAVLNNDKITRLIKTIAQCKESYNP
jgi:hypothetical protein